MTNILLRRLQQNPNFRKKEAPPAPAPADTNGLGVAIQQLIDQAVQTQVADAVEKQRPLVSPKPKTIQQQFDSPPLSSEWPDPPPMAKPAKDLTVSLQRNEVGRVKSVSIGKVNFIVQRNADGQLIGMRQED